MKCRICHSDDFREILDLGHHPPSDAFLTKEQLGEPETYYPLDLLVCEKCSLVQLGYVVPKEVLYNGNYPYTTGVNAEGVKHFRELAESAIKQFGAGFVVDIGGNDGTLLRGFRDGGCKVLNVEPCPHLSTENKVAKICHFWTNDLAKDIKETWGLANIITATNVFAHVDDLHDLMRGVETLLDHDGVFIVESPYVKHMFEKVQFDQIYHEHLSYLSVKPVNKLIKQYGLQLFGVAIKPIHGGSIRLYIGREGRHTPYGLFADPVFDYGDFAAKANKVRTDLYYIVKSLKVMGHSVVGVSAPAKGNTLLNWCKIGPEMLDYITEKSEQKIGKYTPGSHIRIVDDRRLSIDKPDYALLLAHNFKNQIKGANGDFDGHWIIPLPEPCFE